MMLNKVLDKTLKAAKQSALQMYGDDYPELKNIIPANDRGDNNNERSPEQEHQKNSSKKQAQDNVTKGVTFERSGAAAPSEKQSDVNAKLASIREYAAKQTNANIDDSKEWDATDAESMQSENKPATPKQLYSIKDLRTPKAKQSSPEEQIDLATKDDQHSKQKGNPDDPSVRQTEANTTNQAHPSTENNAADESIHKRLDRLESLMHLTLSADELNVSAHPVFHKLLHKGVPKKLINQWFDKISQQGIDADEQPALFQSKLLLLLEDLLTSSVPAKPAKVLLFAGRSGAGKTQLIMKLSQHPTLMKDKTLAIASLNPEGNDQNYYSILKPFCEDNDIIYLQLTGSDDIDYCIEELSSCDHILIDTPSLDTGGHELVEAIAEVQKSASASTEIETHYLVNTAVNGNAFNDPLAVEINADHIALTHIDQSMRWGKTMQLITQTNYKVRYISSGASISGSLLPFRPEKFAQKLIR
jgi:flagellar biosynthesis GTPase FlhF